MCVNFKRKKIRKKLNEKISEIHLKSSFERFFLDLKQNQENFINLKIAMNLY